MKIKSAFCRLIGLPVVMLGSISSAAETVMLEDFRKGEVNLGWQIVNDTVMGGISSSRLDRVDDEIVRFSGQLRLENNGGFASMRSSSGVPNMAKANTIVIRVRGDGRRYQLRLRRGNGWRMPD